ncbi:hypothetical protein GCM10023328_10040 [Modestobacter marinus]|nr:hypothetical protein [Modestobacter marinus]NIH69932.1 hypothetical protein [Modestobacter marinus]
MQRKQIFFVRVGLLAAVAVAVLAACGVSLSSGASDDRPDFATIQTAAESLPAPTDARRYPERDELRRDDSCLDAACPFVRRAYLAPIPAGQVTAFAEKIVTTAGYELLRATDPDCDPERLTCFARARAGGIEVAASVLPLGAVSQPEEAAPAGHVWRLVYLDAHAQ